MDIKGKMTPDYATALNSHYGGRDLIFRIFDAVSSAGGDVNQLTIDSLGPMEELHIAGRKATLELGSLAKVHADMQVIDIGCGIGGPARALAHHYGCHVEGIDISEEFCTAGNILSQRMGLSDKVVIRNANALELPFPDNTFDVAWMQHASMNIPDKEVLFGEIARTLKPHGKIALYEIFSGPEPIKYFPVPWAKDASLSFMSDEFNLQKILKAMGFTPLIWEDITEQTAGLQGWIVNAIREKGLPPLNPGILLGPTFKDMATNLMKNLEENRLKVVRAVVGLTA